MVFAQDMLVFLHAKGTDDQGYAVTCQRQGGIWPASITGAGRPPGEMT